MSQTTKQCGDYLHVLSSCNVNQRQALLKNADSKVVKTICECALNVINGNVPLTPNQKRKLSPHKKTLRSLAAPNKSNAARKRLLIQRGGFVGLLLKTILPVISNLLFKK